MNLGWDTDLVCETCHMQHRLVMPKNFKIWLQPALDEVVLPRHITDEVLNQMFVMNSHSVSSAIWCIIGEELLYPLALVFLYPS